MLTLRRKMRGGTLKHIGAHYNTTWNTDAFGLKGDKIPGTFRLLFNGTLKDGDFYLQGGSDDAKKLIVEMARVIYNMTTPKYKTTPKSENTMALYILEDICEQVKSEIEKNG